MNIHSFSISAVSFFREHFLPSLTAQQKKIILLASLAFGCLAACCAMRPCFFKPAKVRNEGLDEKVPVHKDPLGESIVDLKSHHSPKVDPLIQRNIDLKSFIDQFDHSAPTIFPIGGRAKDGVRKLYHAEVSKLEEYLEVQNKDDHQIQQDLIYICVGHGSLDEQVWPGFIFDALAKNQKVLTTLFENGFKYPSMPCTGWCQMAQELQGHSNETRESVLENLPNFSVQQFLCGFPSLDDKVEEELSENDKKIYSYLEHFYWEKREQIHHVLDSFAGYMESLLRQGKQVVIGSHVELINLQDPLVCIYNKLIKQYPDQIHFLWGWGRINLLTRQELKDEDFVADAPVWTHYDHLKDCLI